MRVDIIPVVALNRCRTKINRSDDCLRHLVLERAVRISRLDLLGVAVAALWIAVKPPPGLCGPLLQVRGL